VQKIAVCGKGGSGKSTITALLANEIRERGHRVLVVDSDESNPGLYRMLGFNERPVPLLELVGGKKNVFPTFRAGATAPSESVLTQDVVRIADLPSEYVAESNGLRLICIGKILQSLEGCACPMGALSREFLKRLRLQKDEVAIIDMEAGIEHFGRGIEASIEGVLAVVEPSFDSVELAEKMNALATQVGVESTWTILNKVTSEEIGLKLRTALDARGVSVVGSIAHDPEIARAGLEGRPFGDTQAQRELARIVDQLLCGTMGMKT